MRENWRGRFGVPAYEIWAVANSGPPALPRMIGRGFSVSQDGATIAQYTPSVTVEQRSEEHTSELQSHHDLVCRLLLEKKNPAGDRPRGPLARAPPDSRGVAQVRCAGAGRRGPRRPPAGGAGPPQVVVGLRRARAHLHW